MTRLALLGLLSFALIETRTLGFPEIHSYHGTAEACEAARAATKPGPKTYKIYCQDQVKK